MTGEHGAEEVEDGKQALMMPRNLHSDCLSDNHSGFYETNLLGFQSIFHMVFCEDNEPLCVKIRNH